MRASTLADYQQRILRVLVHVQRNLDGENGLESLAAIACLSPWHFHRVFRGMVGESLAAHVRRLRLERAAERLKRTTDSITEVALEAGYDSHQAFTRAFRAMTGLPPSVFRRQRGLPLPEVPSGVHFGLPPRAETFEPVDTGGSSMDVSIERVPPRRVAFMRHVGPYDQCGATWDAVATRLGAQGWIGADTLFIGLCHDDPEVTPPEKIRYDCCISVGDDYQGEGPIGVQWIEGGEYAVTCHQGPYSQLGETYARLLGQWIPRSGRRLAAGPCLEIYLNDPDSNPPEEWLTDIYAPLEPAQGETR